jgi:hypothetical protein
MKNFVPCAAAATILAASIAISLPAGAATAAAAPAKNKLLCFDGSSDASLHGGICSLATRGARGPATIANTGGDRDGSYSGVYILNSNLIGSAVANASRCSFAYVGVATGDSPRISIPLDTDDNGVTDIYAFVPARGCTDGTGLVDAIHNPACRIFVGNRENPFVGWAAFVAAFPTAVVGPDGSLPFVIADDAGATALWTLRNVSLGQPGN